MGEMHDHIQQWRHNRKFLSEIPPTYNDWMATVVFYTALHAVDVLFAFDKQSNITSHGARNSILKSVNRYEKIHEHYSPLYRLARTVRYYATPCEWVSLGDIDSNVIRRNLYPLENSVKKLAGLNDLELPDINLQTDPAAG